MIEPQAFAVVGASRPEDPPMPGSGELDFIQLRHHTKNALERIVALVAAVPGLRATVAGRRLVEEVERRVMFAAQASDALFGMTRAPDGIEARLRLLCEALVGLHADRDQMIRIEIACTGPCPTPVHGVVLRVVQELVGNALKHGFYARLLGTIRVEVTGSGRGTRVVVADDGWGISHRSGDGQGLRLVRALIAPLAGSLSLRMREGVTVEVCLPARPDRSL